MPEDGLTPAELADLFRARCDDLLAWFARRTWDREAAVDMTAETFARAVESRARFRGRSHGEAEAWLFGIAGNVLRLYVRKGRVEQRALRRLGLQPPVPTEDDLDRIARDAGLDVLRATIGPHLDALPEQQRRALRLRVVDELSYAEIAERTSASQQAVRARVSRGLRTLRQTMANTPIEDLV
jgi:RNA polymerase sigma factor (sigma-70 family)